MYTLEYIVALIVGIVSFCMQQIDLTLICVFLFLFSVLRSL